MVFCVIDEVLFYSEASLAAPGLRGSVLVFLPGISILLLIVRLFYFCVSCNVSNS